MSMKSQRQRRKIRSRMVGVRLYLEEWDALVQFAELLGQTPSRILRRLLREALTGGPDYFKDELADVARMSRELARIGRNLNQLAKAANRGEWVEAAEVTRVTNATRVVVDGVQARFGQAIRSVEQRATAALAAEDRAGRAGAGAGKGHRAGAGAVRAGIRSGWVFA